MSKTFKRSLILALIAGLLTVGIVMAGSWKMVKYGDSGRNVYTVQYLLRYRGYSLAVDGDFGPTTKSKVKSFQASRGLSADGIVGDNTWEKLIVTTSYGANGYHVKAIQDQLRNRFGCSVAVDGAFGSGTRSAVLAYQRATGLGADGIVGKNTWRSMVNGYEGLSHATARSRLSAAGIGVSSSGGCSNRCATNCTALKGIRPATISGIINFKSVSGCSITVTGGTETGHASGTYSHWNGYKVDISMSSCVSNYIRSHFTYIGGNKYRDGSGNIYYYEVNHWDITYY
jgi:peptidoglycan hydrolase-like protein with peptidoglycan-binding domain